MTADQKIKDMYDSIINEFGKELLILLDIMKKNIIIKTNH